jgi:signal transduction histidine kinase
MWMGKSARLASSTEPELYRFLYRALLWLRWATLLLLFLITLMQPTTSRIGVPTWALLLLFAGYCFIGDIVKLRLPSLRSLAYGAVLDLPMAALLYFLASEPGGPFFVLFFIAVDYAAASLTLRGTLFYTAAIATTAAGIDLILLMGSPTDGDVRMLVARLIMLALVGIGMAIVMRRLVMEQQQVHSVRTEAERLEQIDRLRAEFVANVSHELRTPLTAARAGLGLLETSAIDRLRFDEAEVLDAARRNIESLNLLIDDLLAHNQLEVGALHLERRQLDLRAVVLRAVSAVHSLIQEKGQILELDLPEPLPMQGDEGRLEQMVVNLLSNAYRHTPSGTHIMITGRVMGSEVRLTVSDNGPGIPTEELEAVFQRFHHMTSADRSSGLGLSIARAIIELHAGHVWAESGSGPGVAFCVTLPRLT